MANKRIGEEEVVVGGDHYLFKSDFGFLSELEEISPVGLMILFNNLSGDDCKIEYVKQTLCCSMKMLNGEEIKSDKIEQKVEEFITRNGFEMSIIVAQHMLAYSMIGDEKKSETQELEKKMQLLKKLSISRSVSSRNLQSLWVYRVMLFSACACSSISLYALLILHNKDLMSLVKILINYT